MFVTLYNKIIYELAKKKVMRGSTIYIYIFIIFPTPQKCGLTYTHHSTTFFAIVWANVMQIKTILNCVTQWRSRWFIENYLFVIFLPFKVEIWSIYTLIFLRFYLEDYVVVVPFRIYTFGFQLWIFRIIYLIYQVRNNY